MPKRRLSRTPGTALIVVAVVFIVTLVLAPGAWAARKYKTLYTFTGGTDGSRPYASLIFDQAGNLYGTTEYGGVYGDGTVFELSPNGDGSWTESLLHSFHKNGHDGYAPAAGLIFDVVGNLYSTTYLGGAYDYGTVFQLTSNGDGTWTETVLYSFTGKDGSGPAAGLIFDQSGDLYGTTIAGGTYGDYGTVFRLIPNRDGSWAENVLHSFNKDGRDGYNPWAGLIFDGAGNLFGTTYYGGVQGGGTVFELLPDGDGSWSEKVLHSFNVTTGGLVSTALIFDRAGNLYGTTQGGGHDDNGTVFQLMPDGKGNWKESVIHFFDYKHGCDPWAGLIFDPAGNLYGTTVLGGASGYGTVFELKPSMGGGWKEIMLHSFRDHPGRGAYAGLTFDRRGNLYGTTSGDGGTLGSAFEIIP